MKTAITASLLFTPVDLVESPLLVIEDGRLQSVNSRQEKEMPGGAHHLDFPGMIIAPGFIDIHVHGNAGHDVMEPDDSALAAIEVSMAKHGVTGYLPTTVTAPEERTLKALDHLGRAIAVHQGSKRARPLGIHLEGPFISHAKRGVHPPENLVPPSPEFFDRLWRASHGAVRMMTIAPELPGAIETIQQACRVGVLSSLGHSNATFEQTIEGVAAGARHATHTFNAMRPLDHREPGILGAVLTDDRFTADIIADGIHVDSSVIKLFLAAKGEDRAILITDAISATGMPDGSYKLGAFDVEVRGGRCEYQGKLAGSVLTMDRAVSNIVRFAGWKLQQAVRLATYNPAVLLAMTDRKGLVSAGRDADLVILSPDGNVVRTFIAGMACG